MSPESRNKHPSQKLRRLANRREYLHFRARVIQSVRRFFREQDYLEIDTPLLIPAPAPEAHIDAVKAGQLYLQTSPELCMKQLLAAGYPRLFQICKCFRNEERGRLHLPEFALLEWYKTETDYTGLMAECEALFLYVLKALGMGETLHYQGIEIQMSMPWERLSIEESFDRYASMSLKKALEQGRFDEVMVKDVEPHLGITTPTFAYDYPASMAALARLKPECPHLAERFEVYIGGMELANGFSELTDVNEQRARFVAEQKHRHNLTKEVYPMPEAFLESLPHMPEAAGIALGVDRLVMILADRVRIDDVVAFTPEDI